MNYSDALMLVISDYRENLDEVTNDEMTDEAIIEHIRETTPVEYVEDDGTDLSEAYRVVIGAGSGVTTEKGKTMNLETAQKLMEDKTAAAFPHMDREAVKATVARKYIEVHPNKEAAQAAIEGRAENVKCDTCGVPMNVDTLMVCPVDFANPNGEHFVTRGPESARCYRCKRGI